MQDPIPHEIHLTSYPATSKEATGEENKLLIALALAILSLLIVMIIPTVITIIIAVTLILSSFIVAHNLGGKENISYGNLDGKHLKIYLQAAEQEFQKLGYRKVTVNGKEFTRLAVLASRPWSNRPGRREFVAFYQLEQATPNQQLIYRIDEEVQAKLH